MEINILLVGKTGSGKSATGNTLLDSKVFISKQSSTSVTKEVQMSSRKVCKDTITVVDTAGFADTECKTEEDNYVVLKNQIEEALHYCPKGFHALIYVMDVDSRLTKECNSSFDIITTTLGKDNFSKLGIVLFTHGHEYIRRNKNIECLLGWCKEQKKYDKYLAQCQERIILFENNNSKASKTPGENVFSQQREKLISLIKTMFSQQGSVPYTKTAFDKANEWRTPLDVAAKKIYIKEEMDKTIQETETKLSEMKKQGVEHIAKNGKDLLHKVDSQLKYVLNEDKSTKILQPLIDNLSLHRNKIQQILKDAEDEIEWKEKTKKIQAQREQEKRELEIIQKERKERQLEIEKQQELIELERLKREREYNRQIFEVGVNVVWGLLNLALR